MRQLVRSGFDKRYVLVPLLAAVALVVSAFFVSEARRSYTRELSELIRDRQDRMREIAALVDTCIEAESAQRGYLLTGERKYADPYETERARALALAEGLAERYAETDSDEVAAFEDVRKRIVERFMEMDETLGLMRSGRPGEALAAVKTDVGLRQMQEIREALEALRARERERIYTDLSGWNRELRTNRAINLASTIFTLGLLLVLGLLATREIRRRQDAAIELERLVEQRTAEVDDLSRHMVRIGELEKAALARELHDELGGLLVAMRMDLAQLRRRIVLPDDDAEARWARIDAALAAGVELKRRVIEELRPTLLDNMGLVAAIRWQVEQSCAQGGLDSSLDLPDEEPELEGDAPIALFRAVQEALANVLKHARATRVRVTMTEAGGELYIAVEDDGVGLPDGAARKVGSHGLRQMRLRVQAVGGRMRTERVQPHGTRMTFIVPAPSEGSADLGENVG
jgi:signal transduction histidine kinase